MSFERPEDAKYLMAVEIYASRYGTFDPPAEDSSLFA